MSHVKLVLRDAEGLRKAEVTLPRSAVGGDIVQAAIDKWKLPSESIYTLANTTKNNLTVREDDALSEQLVQDGDVLELLPLATTGA